MSVYLDNGYIDFGKILSYNVAYNFLVGGRGIGKTYGALKYMKEHNINFVFMRRTQTQLDVLMKDEYQPFKKLNQDLGWEIHPIKLTKYSAGFFDCERDKNGKWQPKEGTEAIGLMLALSTISNVRGFDATDRDVLIYDEFIPERHERPIKDEAGAFFNAIETIQRNRELEGKEPLKVLCLANANELANPLFIELKLVKKAMALVKKGIEFDLDRSRECALYLFRESRISEAKKDTALYKLTRGTSFESMSIDNNFQDMVGVKVSSKNLKEYNPVASIGEITIYKHKSNKTYYVSMHKMGVPEEFSISEADVMRFRHKYTYLLDAYLFDNIDFEEYACETLFKKYIYKTI